MAEGTCDDAIGERASCLGQRVGLLSAPGAGPLEDVSMATTHLLESKALRRREVL